MVFAASLVLSGPGCRWSRRAGESTGDKTSGSITSGGLERTYVVHAPESYSGYEPVGLVLVFHGHGGDGSGMARLTHFDEIADRKGFIVAYPDGIDRGWNDGRPEINPGIDDVGFTRDLLKRLASDYRIDARRVFATGISNGGFMCYRLALEMPESFAAIAPVAALMTDVLAAKPPPTTPVSVLLIEGTDDPFVPWSGGRISAGLRSRGTVLSTEATMEFWVASDGCRGGPSVSDVPDNDPTDGMRVRKEVYGGGRDGAEVELLAVEGGGHTWPGGLQYMNARIVGGTCMDIDAGEVMWEFFDAHGRD